ncbi:MAG: metal-sensing transcriptional repressor [Patescibacteria group bacterium]
MKPNNKVVSRHLETIHHLNRIMGQMASLKKLIEDNASCFEIAQLTASITKSFDSLQARTLEGFMLNHILEGKQISDQKAEDLKKIISLSRK